MTRRKLISDVMNRNKLVCLPAGTSVSAASRKMFERKVGAIVVTSGQTLLGIVTERDINFKVVALNYNPDSVTLAEIMTRRPETLPPDAPVDAALEMIQSSGFRHIPVEANGTVIGMVSVRDLFMEVKRDLECDLHDREEFMFGSGYSIPAVMH
ncbi:MAG: CBS domain-containing protein [Rhodospirillaceae bacterium]